MKKFFILGMAVLMVLGFTSWASADFDAGYGTAQFYAVDNDGNKSVTLSSRNYSGLKPLEYRLDSTGAYNPVLGGSINISGMTSPRQLVQLMLDGIVNAYRLFSGDAPLFNSVDLNFGTGDDYKLVLETAVGNDRMAVVPLPSAVWLLGAGLIGLVGVRRKSSAEVLPQD